MRILIFFLLSLEPEVVDFGVAAPLVVVDMVVVVYRRV